MLLLFIHHRLRSDEVSRLAEAHGAASQGGVIASFKSAFEAAPHHGHVAHYFAATNRRALSEFSRYELAHIASVNSDAVALTAAPGTRWALLTHTCTAVGWVTSVAAAAVCLPRVSVRVWQR